MMMMMMVPERFPRVWNTKIFPDSPGCKI